MDFLRSFKTHQSLSSSKEQIAIALITIDQGWKNEWRRRSYPAPLEAPKLFPNGLQLTKVAAGLMFSDTKLGFRSSRQVLGRVSESTRTHSNLEER